MPTELTLIPLPHGVEGRDLLLSVHIGPRLTSSSSNPTLADFPAFVDWPATLAQVSWSVDVGGTALPATVVSAPDSGVWTTLFPAASTAVFSHVVPDFGDAEIYSCPAAAVQDFTQNLYAEIGVGSPEDFPSATALLGDESLGGLVFRGDVGLGRRAQAEAALRSARQEHGYVPSTSVSTNPAEEFLQVLELHTPPSEGLLEHVPLIEVDFHRAVSGVQAYPSLLRKLGLVLDLRLSMAAGSPAQGDIEVRVQPAWSDAQEAPMALTPRVATRLEISDGVFNARPGPGPAGPALTVVDGMLPLEDGQRYRVITVDTDGAAEKLVSTAANLSGAMEADVIAADVPTEYAVPSLRTDGIALARIGMAGQLHASLARASALHPRLSDGSDPKLWAEDLVRGVRVDVLDQARGGWFSLCQRSGRVKVQGTAVVTEDYEGWISTAPTGAADGSSPDLYLPETLFHWTGWSLAVEPPGAHVSNRPDVGKTPVPGEAPEQNPAVARTPEQPHPDLDLTTDFKVPDGTLPRLRFGGRYRFRARTVDLAGDGLGLADVADDDLTHATPEVVHRRCEPLQSPPVYLRQEPVPAEEVERLVVRTDNDLGTAGTPVSERHVVAPMQTTAMVEQLGVLDTGPGGTLDIAKYVVLRDRDGAQLGPALNTTGDIWVLPTAGVDGCYRFTKQRIPLPYLPEPLAQGAAFTVVDGPHAGTSLQVDYDQQGGWPELGTLRLRAVEGSGPPLVAESTPSARVVDVPLRPADVVRLRVSSVLHPRDEDLMTVWSWVRDHAEEQGLPIDGLLDRVRAGRHWMLTPFRTLTLVHATKRPLLPPAFQLWEPSRSAGWTHVELGDLVSLDRPSTQQLAVVADWSERVDEGPGATAPSWQSARSVAHIEPIEYEHPTGLYMPTGHGMQVRHELNDTKRRDIVYQLVANSRFSEHFMTRSTLTSPGAAADLIVDPLGVAEGTLTLTHDGTTLSGYDLDPATGTVRFGGGSTGAAPPAGEVIHARYVPGSVTQTSEPAPRVVPSSARPPAPRVHSVVPTFGWESGQTGNARFSTRRGGGLRVYLDRPWWSSGDGELLAVVLPPVQAPGGGSLPFDLDADAETRQMGGLVTRWGADPVYDAVGLNAEHLRPADFTSAVDQRDGVRLAETGQAVDVAGHRVGFDTHRDQYYADLTVDPRAAYTPFVRLALARFQPESVDPLHLSPVVTCRFSQLAPDRFTTVVPAGRNRVRVLVTGTVYQGVEDVPGRATVRVSVERRSQRWGDAEVGWRPVGSPTTLAPSNTPALVGWSGELPLPGGRAPVRLIIEELERFRTDDKPPGDTAEATYGLRSVYTDIIDLG